MGDQPLMSEGEPLPLSVTQAWVLTLAGTLCWTVGLLAFLVGFTVVALPLAWPLAGVCGIGAVCVGALQFKRGSDLVTRKEGQVVFGIYFLGAYVNLIAGVCLLAVGVVGLSLSMLCGFLGVLVAAVQ